MIVVYAHEEMPETFTKSLFLAGPSLRPGQENEMVSWRNEALKYLEEQNFDGVVFVPENRDGKFQENFSYDNQIEWEEKYLNLTDCIVFWIPRNIKTLPAFTTNIEWGRYESSGKVVLGFPEEAEKIDYIKYYANQYNVLNSKTLEDTLDSAIEMLDKGSERSGGERYVPLFVWKLDSFQSWYRSQRRAGNSLNDARVLYTFRPGFKKFVFLWILKVNVHVASENRDKTNEFVLSRTDISSVCLWHNPNESKSILDIEVVIVKEFRSPANTQDGFIRELAGGSSFKPEEEPEEVAAEEVFEETGLHLDSSKLVTLGGRQLCGTLSSHKSYLFSYKLNEEEIKWLKAQDGIVHGNIKDTERTFVEIYSVKELIENNLTDWATLGMIMSVIAK